VRLLLAAALIAGLLGMHVMTAPGAHSAHASSANAGAPSMSAHDSAAEALTISHAQKASCGPSGCADALPASDAGVWAVICVLALLLTALIAARPLAFRRTPRRASALAEVGRATADRAPRHPPSLIVLSISRT